MSLKNIKLFVTPILADDSEPLTLEGLIAELGGPAVPEPEVPPVEPPAEDPPKVDPPAGDPVPAEPPKVEPPVYQQDPKQAQAFANMRVQNKQLEGLVNEMAGILGVGDAPDKAAALKQAILNVQAKQQNVPVALLERLQILEDADVKLKNQEFERNAYLGFDNVKKNFNLNDVELKAYSEDLFDRGINPFQTNVDLVADYKLRNFDTLLEKSIQAGIAKEAARAAKALESSTTPSKLTTPPGASEPSKVNTVNDLANWFNSQSK